MVDLREDVQRIRDGGLLGFVDVVVARCARQIDLAEDGVAAGDPRWRDLHEARAAWPELLGVLQQTIDHTPPLAQLLLVFALEPEETAVLMTLWGLAASDTLAERARALDAGWSLGLQEDEREAGDLGHPAEVVVRIASPEAHDQQRGLHALRPQGKLRRHVLVRLADGRRRDPRRERVELDPDVAAALLGIWRPPPMALGAVRARGSRPRGVVAVQPAHELPAAALRRALGQSHVRAALLGRAGAGKRTVARDAARRAGRPLIEVRLSAAPDQPALVEELLARCRRDALLQQAVLYVELADETVPAAVARVFDEEPGRLILGVSAEGAEGALPGLRARWPGLVAAALPTLDMAAQAGLWEQLLRARGARLPARAALEAHACRPGLVIGDLVRATETVLAPAPRGDDIAPATGDALARELGAILTEQLERDLAALAEALWSPRRAGAGPDALVDRSPAREHVQSLDQAWHALAAEVRRGQVRVSAWGATEALHHPRPLVARVTGSDARRACALARSLARAVGLPLYRVDLGYLTGSRRDDPARYFDRLFAAAGRAGALLLVTPVDTLALDRPGSRSVANALAAHLDAPPVTVLLHGAERPLPVALASRVEHIVSADT